MSEMVERVAKAIAEADRGCDLWDEISEDGDGRGYLGKDDFRKFARAAIKAMREPTDAMIAAVRRAKPHDMDITEAWPIAIDEALK